MAQSKPLSAANCINDYDPWTTQRAAPDYSVFVSKLPKDATAGALCQAFEPIAKVAGAEIAQEEGHGFVHFHTLEELKKAVTGPAPVYRDAAGTATTLVVSPVVEPRNVLRIKGLSPAVDVKQLEQRLQAWLGPDLKPTKVTVTRAKSSSTAQVHFADNEQAKEAYIALQRAAPDLQVDFAPMRDLQNKLTLRRMERCCYQTLKDLGEDPERPGIKKTPHRWAQALLYLTKGYDETLEELVNDAIFDEKHHELVLVKDIEIFSMCEHHMLPFWGKVHIAYIPKGKVLGLSKLARVAEMYARRLQVQERLTRQIASAIERSIQPLGVAVVVDCCHMCMVMRGVQKVGASTVTSSVLGEFERNPSTRAELFSLIGLHKAKL
eukprot:EG_transcript_6561